jgi:hypothetical protein
MTDWTANLPTMDMGALRPLFDELAGEHQAASLELDADRKMVRTPTRRRMMDLRRVANAAKHLDSLPLPGETWHLVSKGNYSQWDFVPAVLEMVAPATLDYLAIVTLSFSRINLEQLLALIDAGQVRQVDFVYSIYIKSVEKEACSRLHAELDARGQRTIALRQHCKILLMQTTVGDCYTIESSANLRSCRNIEQSTFTNDPALLQFHRGWLNSLFTERGQR